MTESEHQTQTPDYLVRWNGVSAVVEEKEITPDAEERRISAIPFECWGETECTFYGGAPGERVRKKIGSAVKQLKGGPSPKLPRLLVLANRTAFPEVCDGYAVAVAMFGFESVLISSDTAPVGGAKILKKWHGSGRRMTRYHCRSIAGDWIFEYAAFSCTITDLPQSIRRESATY